MQESAGTLFTVKPPGPQPLNGSMGQLTPTLKSVGGLKKILPQPSANFTTHVSVGVGAGVGVGVPACAVIAIAQTSTAEIPAKRTRMSLAFS